MDVGRLQDVLRKAAEDLIVFFPPTLQQGGYPLWGRVPARRYCHVFGDDRYSSEGSGAETVRSSAIDFIRQWAVKSRGAQEAAVAAPYGTLSDPEVTGDLRVTNWVELSVAASSKVEVSGEPSGLGEAQGSGISESKVLPEGTCKTDLSNMAGGVSRDDFMILVVQRKKNLINDVKTKLPSFEVCDTIDKEASQNLEWWLSMVEDLTTGEQWDDLGRINLALERLRGEPLSTWKFWKAANTKDVWSSLKERLLKVHAAKPSLSTLVVRLCEIKRKDGEPVIAFFNRLYQVAWELVGLNKELEPIIMGAFGFLLAKDLPASFIQKHTLDDIVSPITLLGLYNSWASDNPELVVLAKAKASAGTRSVAAATSPRVPEQDLAKGEMKTGKEAKGLSTPLPPQGGEGSVGDPRPR
ncbi:hypothetical protein C7M84_004231 [Penaeus vannamei]|uniref:Uncharacterized protein n=1 Tax=Penaeus vannamei TaxID=6689 RepID=A0A3R7QT49_PENVA|nr:hypothetical protein C7M84_004231 [Penaeus vannamei]